MKKFDQLTKDQQADAINRAANRLLEDICEGAIRFNDELNGDTLQARIDAAAERAERNQTPWFTHEFIMDTCRDDIMSLAQCAAEDSLYAEHGENVESGIAT